MREVIKRNTGVAVVGLVCGILAVWWPPVATGQAPQEVSIGHSSIEASTISRLVETTIKLAHVDVKVLVAGACTYACDSCGEGRHRIIKAVWSNAESHHLERCNNGGCHLHECDGAFSTAQKAAARADEVERLRRALVASSPAELAEFVVANAGLVQINQKRESLQIKGCDGRIAISYTDNTVGALAALLQ